MGRRYKGRNKDRRTRRRERREIDDNTNRNLELTLHNLGLATERGHLAASIERILKLTRTM